MGFGRFIKKAWAQTSDFGDRASGGKAFGDSVWGRYAANITGTTTSAKLIGRARQKEQVSIDSTLSDSQSMRPTQGYSRAAGGVAGDAATAMKTEQDARDAILNNQRDAQLRQQDGQIAARVRRSRYADQPGNKNGTIKTGSLGVPGGQALSFSQLLGL